MERHARGYPRGLQRSQQGVVDKHGEAWDQADKEGREFIDGLGREVIALDSEETPRWTAAVKPILDEYVAATSEKELPGEAFLKDVQALVAQSAAGAGA